MRPFNNNNNIFPLFYMSHCQGGNQQAALHDHTTVIKTDYVSNNQSAAASIKFINKLIKHYLFGFSTFI